jgi:hypothetical protein
MTHKYTPKEETHLFRGLRHVRVGTLEEMTRDKDELEKYDAEIQSHLRDDASDHIAAQAEAKKKGGLEGLARKQKK